MFADNLINKLKCLFAGHITYQVKWMNTSEISPKRKGGRKRSRGNVKFKTRHYQIICVRCGKILKKK